MTQPFVPSRDAALVRYQVADLERAIDFYTQSLGFQVVQKAGPIGVVSRGALHLLFSGPGSSGSRQILVDDPDGNPIELHEAPRNPS